jgi:elongation factor G
VVREDVETGQTVLGGMGELHLEILKDRMDREYRVEANTGRPMVAYHETVAGTGRVLKEFDREIAGKRQYAGVEISVAPAERGAGISIEFDVKRDGVPVEFHAAVQQGIEDGLATGVLARYPLTDVTVTVTGGSCDAEASTEVAFRTAAVMALREAVLASQPELLEPLMALEIRTPDEAMGDVLNDLNARRGKVRDMTARGDIQVIRAGVPLAELFGYSTAIRSLTKGRATYTMEPEHFEIVPAPIKDELLNR